LCDVPSERDGFSPMSSSVNVVFSASSPASTIPDTSLSPSPRFDSSVVRESRSSSLSSLLARFVSTA